jgi:hypothetical protein
MSVRRRSLTGATRQKWAEHDCHLLRRALNDVAIESAALPWHSVAKWTLTTHVRSEPVGIWRGKYSKHCSDWTATIDLHGLDRRLAEVAIRAAAAVSDTLRAPRLRFITGSGRHSTAAGPVLRELTLRIAEAQRAAGCWRMIDTQGGAPAGITPPDGHFDVLLCRLYLRRLATGSPAAPKVHRGERIKDPVTGRWRLTEARRVWKSLRSEGHPPPWRTFQREWELGRRPVLSGNSWRWLTPTDDRERGLIAEHQRAHTAGFRLPFSRFRSRMLRNGRLRRDGRGWERYRRGVAVSPLPGVSPPVAATTTRADVARTPTGTDRTSPTAFVIKTGDARRRPAVSRSPSRVLLDGLSWALAQAGALFGWLRKRLSD